MAFKLFKNKKDEPKKEKQKVVEKVGKKEAEKSAPALNMNFSFTGSPALRNFYVSEKASLLNDFNQYVFKVERRTNKVEVKKQVEKTFNVKVKSIKILNMPGKRRDLGRHPGFKTGFKKAVVVLKEGYTIEQAKP